MKPNEFDEFVEVWGAAWETYGQRVTSGALELAFAALADVPLATVRTALTKHMRDPERGRFAPKPADVMAQIKAATPSDGHPSPNEAWATVALIIGNETETAFLTEPMREAWAKADAVMKLGDEVGARMAFLETYATAVAAARQRGEKPAWAMTLGTDPEKRAMAVRSALAANQITQEQANALLPAPEPARVMGLLESAAKTAKDPDTAKKGLEALKAAIQRMETRAARAEQERLEELAREREEFEKHKAEVVAAALAKAEAEKAA